MSENEWIDSTHFKRENWFEISTVTLMGEEIPPGLLIKNGKAIPIRSVIEPQSGAQYFRLYEDESGNLFLLEMRVHDMSREDLPWLSWEGGFQQDCVNCNLAVDQMMRQILPKKSPQFVMRCPLGVCAAKKKDFEEHGKWVSEENGSSENTS